MKKMSTCQNSLSSTPTGHSRFCNLSFISSSSRDISHRKNPTENTRNSVNCPRPIFHSSYISYVQVEILYKWQVI